MQLLRGSRNFSTLRDGEERSKKSQVKVVRVHVSRSKSPRSTFYDVSISGSLIVDERKLIIGSTAGQRPLPNPPGLSVSVIADYKLRLACLSVWPYPET